MMWRRNMSKCCLAHRSLLCCFPRSCSGRWLPAWRSVEPGVLWYQWDLFIVMSLNSESIEDIWNAEGWRALTIDFWFDSLICFSSSFCMFSFSLPRHFSALAKPKPANSLWYFHDNCVRSPCIAKAWAIHCPSISMISNTVRMLFQRFCLRYRDQFSDGDRRPLNQSINLWRVHQEFLVTFHKLQKTQARAKIRGQYSIVRRQF